jgi:hypothetical protein
VRVDGTEEGGFLLAGDAGGVEIGIDVFLGVVVSGNLVPFSPLLMQAEPCPPPFAVIQSKYMRITARCCLTVGADLIVVSGGPANRTALQEPCRPFRYNPVELSRFAGAGLFGI